MEGRREFITFTVIVCNLNLLSVCSGNNVTKSLQQIVQTLINMYVVALVIDKVGRLTPKLIYSIRMSDFTDKLEDPDSVNNPRCIHTYIGTI
jgi:hypothetical protein